MKKALAFMFVFTFSCYSEMAYSQINLSVKINQGTSTNESVAIVKTITGHYEQDIEIASEGLKNKIVLSLRKFKNILVNGSKINPVQIDMKLVDEAQKTVGRPQTITSFYNRSAEFTTNDMNVKINFEEI